MPSEFQVYFQTRTFPRKKFYQPKTYQTQNRIYTISCNKQKSMIPIYYHQRIKGANHPHLWRKNGKCLYEPSSNNRVSSLCFPLTFKMEDYLPKTPMVRGNQHARSDAAEEENCSNKPGGFSGEGPLNVCLGERGGKRSPCSHN